MIGLRRGLAALLMVLPMLAAADQAAYNAGTKARQAGDYAEAGRQLEQALASWRASEGEDHAQTLAAMHELAIVRRLQGRAAEALALNEKVLAVRRERLGERHPDTLATMNNMGTALSDLGRNAEQLVIARRVLTLRTEVLGPLHPETLRSMQGIAVALDELGRLDESLEMSARVIELRTQVLGPRHRDTLLAIGNRAVALYWAGRYDEARQANQQVMEARAEVLGPRHPLTLTALLNLAVTHGALGQHAEYLRLGEQALRLYVEVLGESHPETLTAMGNLATALATLDRPDDSLELLRKAQRLWIQAGLPDTDKSLAIFSNIGSTYDRLGRHAEQLAVFEAGLPRARKSLGENHGLTLDMLGNLAQSHAALGHFDQAVALHRQSLERRLVALGEEHPFVGRARHDLAATLVRRADMKDLPERETLFAAALAGRRKGLGERHPDTLTSMHALAATQRARQRLGDAVAWSAAYVEAAEWQRVQPGLSADDRRAVFREYAGGYRFFAATHAALGQVREAWRLAELGKARTLLESLSTQRAARAGVLPAAAQAQLDELDRRIGALDPDALQSRSAEARAALEARRNEALREHQALQQQLRAAHPKYARLLDVRLVGLDDLPGLLPADSVALSYLCDGDELTAFIVQPGGAVRTHALGAVPQLAELVDLYRRALAWEGGLRDATRTPARHVWRLADGSLRVLDAAVARPGGAVAVDDVGTLGRYLAARLLEPLRTALSSGGQWVISPDGPLAQLPFEALPWQKGRLVDRVQVHYTPSLSVYALARELQRDYRELPDRRALFAMGHARYESAGQRSTGGRGRTRSAPVRSVEQLRELDTGWPNLPGTEGEVLAVQRLFPRASLVQLGVQATEANLQALNGRGELKDFRYLLFSAHGYVSLAQPALSAIVLGLQDRAPGTDGYVTAAEWPSYDLRSDLTVLSACDTGVGAVVDGEGVMGLPFALQLAGNVNTVLTLWPVDDRATAGFVEALFRHLRDGRSPAQALSMTKREFARHPRWSAPRYWAPFVLVGAG